MGGWEGGGGWGGGRKRRGRWEEEEGEEEEEEGEEAERHTQTSGDIHSLDVGTIIPPVDHIPMNTQTANTTSTER